MLRYSKGNLLDASADALVNTVNEVGVMGKGIALLFRERFPSNTREYTSASKEHRVRVGKMFVTETGELFPKWIINFPTKRHWRHPSRIEWIREGLDDLVKVIRELGVRSVALPPLGCGNGGLDWSTVRPLIEERLRDLDDVDILVFEPGDSYYTAPKAEGVVGLTVARALIVELVRRYSVLGLDCTVLEVQKLAYFLQRSVTRLGLPDPLDLRFVPNKFGPYADRLRHLLNGLDGSYLHAEKRLADAGPMDLIWPEATRREEVDLFLASEGTRYVDALEETAALIDGFESPLGLELLATVDWLVGNSVSIPTVTDIRARLLKWPAGDASAMRKLSIFDERLIQLALSRLSTRATA